MAGVFDPFMLYLIGVGAVVTLINRLAGHYVLARFEPIPFRVEAALEAVPVAVMTTLFIPATVNGGWQEWAALMSAMLLCLRLPFIFSVVGALAVLLALRTLSG